MIRLAKPSLDTHEVDAVKRVLASGWLIQGERVAQFEQRLGAMLGGRSVVAVSSGTAALHLALLALSIRPGDAVLVPTFSWVSTANMIEICGATPIFVDIEPDTFNVSASTMQAAIARYTAREQKAQLRAAIVVHGFGVMAEVARIRELVQANGLAFIEDAACAIGSELDSRPGGAWGDISCLSFHPRKVVTTGEGGACVTADIEVARRLRILRNHGLDPDTTRPDFVMPGFNYRLTDFQAAIGLVQLDRLNVLMAQRCEQAAIYDGLFAGTNIRPQRRPTNSISNFQSYVVLLPEGTDRDGIIVRLREAGIEAAIGTWHIPMTTYFRQRYGYKLGDFPVTDMVFARTLTLPLSPAVSRANQDFIAATLSRLVRAKDVT